MQLPLNFDGRAATVLEIHRRLAARFGPQGPFRQLSPVSQLAMGMIGGRTRSETSRAAFEALTRRYTAWSAVRDAPAADIRDRIRAVTFAGVKATRLKAALSAISKDGGEPTLKGLKPLPTEEAITRLERLPGVGRKIAAATLNFSTLRKRALVIDTHHLRILRRLKLVGTKANFAQAYDSIAPSLPSAWTASDFDEHHQLMKKLGQTICRSGVPVCRRCPIRMLCPTPLQ